jgi:hypothetical protein
MNIKATTAHAKSTIVALALVCALPGMAWAKDSMTIKVENATQEPLIVNNGHAVGTIQLFYTVNANDFPLGEFASFDLNWMTVIDSNLKNATNYGTGIEFTLSQDQEGGHVELLPDPRRFILTKANQSETSRVTVHIVRDKDGNLPPNVDTTDLVGNLKLNAGSKVGTVTNIQIHIRLVHPDPTACLKVYNFITDQDFTLGILDTVSLKMGTTGPKSGVIVKNSTPSQFSDNVLIVNTCAMDQSFDLGIALDDGFTTSSNGNPVQTYTAAGEFTSSSFGLMMTGEGTPNGQNLCLQNVKVVTKSSFLATVHSKIKDNLAETSLPTNDGTFDFAAKLFETGNPGCTGLPHSLAWPDSATFALPFTTSK